MLHARKDYDQIEDPRGVRNGGIPYDEPVFLLRGQDKVAAKVLRIWAVLHRANGGDEDIAVMVEKHADLMDEWPHKKSADLPKELKAD